MSSKPNRKKGNQPEQPEMFIPAIDNSFKDQGIQYIAIYIEKFRG